MYFTGFWFLEFFLLVMRFHENGACVLLIIEGASLTSQYLAHKIQCWVYYILKQIDECQDFSHH